MRRGSEAAAVLQAEGVTPDAAGLPLPGECSLPAGVYRGRAMGMVYSIKAKLGEEAVCKILENNTNWIWLLFIIIIYCRKLYTIVVIKYPTLPETTPTSELPRFSTLSTNAYPLMLLQANKILHPYARKTILLPCLTPSLFIYQFLFLVTPRILTSQPELWRVKKAWGSGIMVFNSSAITC